jgi:hypothetical protein
MTKKHKFNLADLVLSGFIKTGDTLFFVSNPKINCVVFKTENDEYKVKVGLKEESIYSFVQTCLGQDPPDYSCKWVKTTQNITLYDLWQKHLNKDN